MIVERGLEEFLQKVWDGGRINGAMLRDGLIDEEYWRDYQVRSERLGSFEYLNTYGRSGDHQIGGMFVARGPGIAPGVMGRPVSTMDLAPTFAQMLGAAMQNVDGAPIGELLDSRAPTP